jgi:holo-[acyl-carrier protein] synthase
MSCYVGIDLVSVEQVGESLSQHGDQFLERVYTARERRQCHGSTARLAARFAAKEATMKALRRGGEGIGWRSVEVLDDAQGQCTVTLSGGAAALAAQRKVASLSVSVSHHRRHAAAVVIAHQAGADPGRIR